MTPAEIQALAATTDDWLSKEVQFTVDAALVSMKAAPADSFVPRLFVVCRDPATKKDKYELLILSVPFNEHDDKHKAIFQIGKAYSGTGKFPVLAILSSEAWMATFKPDEQIIRPTDHPQREEVISIMAMTVDRKRQSVFIQVTRDGNNDFVPGETIHMDKVSSPLLDEFYRGFFDNAARRTAHQRN